ncbi:hypothetical protein BGW38_008210, partial [Lunasporangiospora selenospora]
WYYTVADILLIAQIYYYRRTSPKASFESVITHSSPESIGSPHPGGEHGEHSPLIQGPGATGPTYSSIPQSEHLHENEHERVIHKAAMVANATASAHPPLIDHHHQHHQSDATLVGGSDGSLYVPDTTSRRHQRRASAHSAMTTNSTRYRSKMSRRRKMVKKVLLVVFPILLVSIFVWGDQDVLTMMRGDGSDPNAWVSFLLGWGSAVLYLGSRIPQIYKNWRLKSCEGLSVMMFVFSVLGNVFYVVSIFVFSLEWDHLMKNLPWWLGSGGTLIFDFTIFFQFYIYRNNQPLTEALKEAAATGELNEDALLATADDGESNEEDSEDSESDSLTAGATPLPKAKSDKRNESTGGPSLGAVNN